MHESYSGQRVLVEDIPPKPPKRPTHQNTRLILAFFPAGDIAAQRAEKRSYGSGTHITLVGDGDERGSSERRYAGLCLPGEQLLLAEAPARVIQKVVEQIRRDHPAGLFVIPEVLDEIEDFRPNENGHDYEWAREAARSSLPVASSDVLLIRSRLTKLETSFEKATADLIASAALGHTPGPTANWILENGYLVQSDVEEIRRSHEGVLPKPGPGANYAQVHLLAHGLLRHNEHEVTEESMRDALREFQTVRFMTTAELWSFGQMLRLALLEELSRLACDAANAQQHREVAYLWADRLIASARHGEESLADMLKRMNVESYAHSGAFLAALSELLQGEEDVLPAFQIAVEQGGRTLTEFVRAENTQEAYRSGAAARAFGSLRALARLEIRKVFERASIVDEELRGEDSGVYAASDFETRDRCRKAVERISRWCGASEQNVARMAVALASEQSERTKHQVPYFLVAEGIAELERKAGARLPLRVKFVRATRHHAAPLYFASVLLLTACLDAIALQLAQGAGVRNPVQLYRFWELSRFSL